MADKKEVSDIVSYSFGILSIVMAFFQPLMGLIIGIIGFYQSKRVKSELSKKGKKLNTIGIVLSIIFLVIYISVSVYLAMKGIDTSGLQNFPSV